MAGVLRPKLERWFAAHYRGFDSADLAQKTLIVISNRLPEFEMRNANAFMRWVLEIARYVALGALRDREREAKLTVLLEAAPETSKMGLSTYVKRAELRERLWREIEKLPDSLRRAVENMLADGDARDFAEGVGLDWGTVRGYRSRAIARLRQALRSSTTPTPT